MRRRADFKKWYENVFLGVFLALIISVSASGPWNGYILPSFQETKTNVTAYVGNTAVLPCSILSLGTKKVVWKKVNQEHALTIDDFVFTSDPRHSIDHTDHGNEWNLVIKDVNKGHAGLYECQISTKEDLFRRVKLNVIDPPPLDESKEPERKIFRPAIHIAGPNFTEKGEPIRITCNATSDTITPERMDWFLDGRKLKPNEETGISITNSRHSESKTLYSTLVIHKSSMADAGTYICRSSKEDVVSHQVVVLNADSSHEKRGFPDKSKDKTEVGDVEKSERVDPGNSAAVLNIRVHYLISNCLLILLTISSYNR